MARILVGLVLMMALAEAAPPYRKRVRCTDPNYRERHNLEHWCPRHCPGDCEVECHSCKPYCTCDRPGAVCQDPRFIGGDGITFYFHGRKNRDFCLLSDSNLHINGHFIGKRNPVMKRDFTWVQSIGGLFDDHKLFIGAQKTSKWDNAIDRLSLTFSGEPIYLPQESGAKWQSSKVPGVSIVRWRDANAIVAEVEGIFKIKAAVVPITEEESRVHGYGITEDDCLAHLDLGFKFYSLTGNVHGVLGQTYAEGYTSRVKMSAAMPVMGGDSEFSSSGLFTTDCAVARFGQGELAQVSEYASLECGSSFEGRDIVCKK